MHLKQVAEDFAGKAEANRIAAEEAANAKVRAAEQLTFDLKRRGTSSSPANSKS